MAKYTAETLLNGHGHSGQHKMSNNNGRGHMQKKSKKALKSNITNQFKNKRMESRMVGDVESDDDDDDGMTADEATANDDDADVSALPNAQQRRTNGAAPRSAGHDLDEGTKMMTDVNVSAGASEYDFVFGDEDDYAGVENVSDSDDERSEVGEASILRSAEQDLIAEFETTETRRNASRMTFEMDLMDLEGAENAALGLGLLQAPADHSNDLDLSIDFGQDPFQGLPVFGTEYTNMAATAESALWRMPDSMRTREGSDPMSANPKRVRFEEVREPSRSATPSGSEDEDPSEAFPDLFMPEDSLARQSLFGLVADDVFSPEDADDNESFYDFGDEHENLAFQIDEESDSDSDGTAYESDDSGDTTDEETMEESVVKTEERRQAAVKAVEMAKKEIEEEKQRRLATPRTPKTPRNASISRPSTPRSGKGPRMGSFEVDPTRAAITPDVEGGKVKIQPPSKPLEKDRAYWERAKSAASSREGSPRNSFHIVHSVSSDSMPSRPFTAKSTLGSMFGGNLDILRTNDTNGIAEDLISQVMSRPQSSYSSFDGTEDSNSQKEVDLAMQDLVNIDDSDSDDEMQSGAITSPTTHGVYMTMNRDTSDLFDHFQQNRAVIGAFRQNQTLAKTAASQASHPAQRASTHEYNALQKGRRGAANTPITPARKKRASQEFSAPGRSGVRKPLSSPLTSKRPRSRGNSLAHADLLQTIARNPFDM